MITMIALTSDKLTPISAGFPMKDAVRLGPEWPTAKQITSLQGLAPPKNIVQDHTSQYGAMKRVGACQGPLYPHLSAIVYRPVQVVA
jgi:hypothetical protein